MIGTKNLKNKINLRKFPSLEAQIASISDDIAYNNHDIQDGYSAGLFTIHELKEISFFNEILKKYSTKLKTDKKTVFLPYSSCNTDIITQYMSLAFNLH